MEVGASCQSGGMSGLVGLCCARPILSVGGGGGELSGSLGRKLDEESEGRAQRFPTSRLGVAAMSHGRRGREAAMDEPFKSRGSMEGLA